MPKHIARALERTSWRWKHADLPISPALLLFLLASLTALVGFICSVFSIPLW